VEISSRGRSRVDREAGDADEQEATEEPSPRGRAPSAAPEDPAAQGAPRFMPLRLIIEKLLAKNARLLAEQEEQDEDMDEDEEQTAEEREERADREGSSSERLPVESAHDPERMSAAGVIRLPDGREVAFRMLAEAAPLPTATAVFDRPGPALELTDSRYDVDLQVAGRTERISFVRDDRGDLVLTRDARAQ
jgi:hypothetical protein